jgi:two-component system CheB/CheR fusion protein
VPRSLPSEANLHRAALENLGPPSILVDEAHQILHISETAGRYLLHPPGPPIADVVELVRPELRMDVRLSLHRAFEQGQTSLSLPIPVRFNGKPQRVYVQVKPVTGQELAHTALILFIEGGPVEASTSEGHLSEEGRSANEIIQNLRDELQSSRTRLNASHEEENTAIEELRAANEELQFINEEYRSTAEELETSQEGQRSINEELQTLNHEMKLRLEAVARAHNDLQNLLAVTDVGTLFLDGALRIKGFTSRVTDLFNITVKDEGRPLTDFTHRLIYDGLPADAESVLKSLVPLEREVQNRDSDWFLVRLRPYRTTDDRIEGVVVTFIDVTERRRTELALRDSEDRLLLAKEASDLGVQDYDPKTNECWWDERARDLWDIKAGETVTADLIWSRIHPDDLQMARSSFDKALDPRGDGVYAAEFRVRGDGKGERWIRANGKAFFSGDTNGRHAARLVATVQDVTQSRSWERRQRLLLSELSHRVGNTLAVVVSMARQTFRRAKDYNQALASFEGRLGALSAAQELLISNDWQGVQLEALARRQLGAEFLENGGRVTFSGPPVLLAAGVATPFGLLLHELGTNALKHGSLSKESGTAGLTWRLQPQADGQLLEVEWREAGGAKPDGKFKPGLGSFLIESGLPGAKVTREIHRDGLSCTIRLPLERMEPHQ